jgi:hypothetical protein
MTEMRRNWQGVLLVAYLATVAYGCAFRDQPPIDRPAHHAAAHR